MKKKLLSCIGIMMSLTMVCSMGGFVKAKEPHTSAEHTVALAAKKATKKTKMTTLKILGTNTTFAGTNGRTVKLHDWATQGKSKRWKKLTDDLKKKGIKLDLNLIEPDQYETTCQTMAASGEFAKYDIVNILPLDVKTRINLAKQGQFQPVDDIWEKYSDGPTRDLFSKGVGKNNLKRILLDDKKCYWFPSLRTVSNAGGMERNVTLGFAIRQDWLDAIGEKIPTTLDALTSDLEKFRNDDVNKSGKKDEFLCLPYDGFSTDIAQWFGLGCNITFADTQNSGKVTSPWYQKHIKDYIAYMNQLYDKGLLKLYDKNAQTYQTNDQVAGIAEWALELWLEPSISTPKGSEYPWFAPFYIQAVQDQKPLIRVADQNVPADNGFAVPAKSKKQKAIAKVLDYLVSDEGVLLSQQGVEGVSYEMKDGMPKQIIDGSLKNTDTTGGSLWNNNIFPNLELKKDGRVEMKSTVEFANDHGVKNNATAKSDFIDTCNKNASCMTSYLDPYALPTLKEVNKINEITTDLTTYSSELLTKLITGEKSLTNWDSYMKDLKKLGLDDLIKINQARYDRTK